MSVTITSNNQMGGITAHTVSIGARERVLSEEMKAQLIQQVKKGSRVVVTSVMGDQEALKLAEQCLNYLRSEGYAPEGVDQALFAQSLQGQRIQVHEDGSVEILIGSA